MPAFSARQTRSTTQSTRSFSMMHPMHHAVCATAETLFSGHGPVKKRPTGVFAH